MFFRPVTLSATALADAWESGDRGEALAPLEQALDALVADQDLFAKIIDQTNPALMAGANPETAQAASASP